VGRMDAGVDGGTDACIVDGALDHPARTDAPVLRGQEDRVVRLVPGRPEVDGGQACAVRGQPVSAVAGGGGEGEVPEVAGILGRSVPSGAVLPGWRTDDREQELNAGS
jgi:hypothetical protein